MHLSAMLRNGWNRWRCTPHGIRSATYSGLMLGGQLGVVPWLIERRWHGPVATSPTARSVGTVLIGGGTTLAGWGIVALTKQGAGTPFPFDPPMALVQSGPYRYTRNPMMLGLVLVLLGAALRRHSTALAVYALVLFGVYNGLVLLEEEPYLARTHGATWQAYAQRTRRWL